MRNTQATRNDLVDRDTILKMLSDDEVASVCTAETKPGLANGVVFIELDHLDRGLQLSAPGLRIMGDVLPKKAVHEKTWKRIEALLDHSATANRAL
jgi:hypothetical protein